MNSLPDFHDGYFDGIILPREKVAHTFLRTVDGVKYTVILLGLEALSISNLWAGNIVFEFSVLDQPTSDHIRYCYHLEPSDTARTRKLLEEAQAKKLMAIEMTSSYGAEMFALCSDVSVSPEYRIEAT